MTGETSYVFRHLAVQLRTHCQGRALMRDPSATVLMMTLRSTRRSTQPSNVLNLAEVKTNTITVTYRCIAAATIPQLLRGPERPNRLTRRDPERFAVRPTELT